MSDNSQSIHNHRDSLILYLEGIQRRDHSILQLRKRYHHKASEDDDDLKSLYLLFQDREWKLHVDDPNHREDGKYVCSQIECYHLRTVQKSVSL